MELNSTRVEFDSIAPKQGFLRLRLDFCFLILTGGEVFVYDFQGNFKYKFAVANIPSVVIPKD